MTFINDKTNEEMYIEGTRVFRYHGNTICIVDDEKKSVCIVPLWMVHAFHEHSVGWIQRIL